MKNIFVVILLLEFCGNLFAVNQSDSVICYISGNVMDRPQSKEAILVESGKDFRVSGGIRIPIENGEYSYTLHSDVPREYELMFDDEMAKGNFQIRQFFSGNGSVEIVSYSEERDTIDSIVSDLPDNILQVNWWDRNVNVFGEDLSRIYNALDSIQPDSAEYAALICERDSVLEVQDSTLKAMISEKPTLFGLAKIRDKMQWERNRQGLQDYITIFENVYRNSMSDHPYAKEVAGLIEIGEIKPGNAYPDYTVLRTDGSTERISDFIADSPAVIDLWASWCGPCRRHSIELIPIYEAYKDKGFKVVAIARESDNSQAMEAAIEKDGYPWESFIEINDSGRIWQINAAAFAGGRIILVGADGKIVGIDVSADEIKAYLESIYGSTE